MQLRWLGRQPYSGIEAAMREFSASRSDTTDDELWLVEHDAVFTQGLAGRDEHVHAAGDIPIVRTNRGGQVTFHGPGQVVAYPLVDLKRLRIYVKEYVYRLEQAVIDVLASRGVTGHRVPKAPGVYVRLADPFGHSRLEGDSLLGLGKIAALGIKVSNHRAYHGVALNVAMDLEPFARIDPCGYRGLVTVDLRTLGVEMSWQQGAEALASALQRHLA